MKGASKVIMGATLVMIVSIAILLGLVLILLAELYCSLFLGRRRKNPTSTSSIPVSAAAAGTSEQRHSGTLTLGDFYAQGVINAPRNLLFPSVYNALGDPGKQHSGLFEFCGSPAQDIASSPHCNTRRNVSASPSFVQLAPPKLVYEVPHYSGADSVYDDGVGGDGNSKETYIYICNPIYDNDANRSGRVETPFETPDSSPSRLEANGSYGEEDKHDAQIQSPISTGPSSPRVTPPLTPMKKLPAQAISITLRDARSLATSGSESNSNHEGVSSSLSTGSPCTSPSW